MRFRRVKTEKAEFEKMHKGVAKISADEARDIMKAQKFEADFIAGKAEGQTLNTMVQNQERNLGAAIKVDNFTPMKRNRSYSAVHKYSAINDDILL